ncbi:GGDEF domain-containing protein [Candidatus Woesearchaeota archaeon]|nr:GGDEF domain-containing protein [Candidatus Woesearchaeota archaeon]
MYEAKEKERVRYNADNGSKIEDIVVNFVKSHDKDNQINCVNLIAELHGKGPIKRCEFLYSLKDYIAKDEKNKEKLYDPESIEEISNRIYFLSIMKIENDKKRLENQVKEHENSLKELKNKTKRLEEIAYVDSLTGMYNRRSLDERKPPTADSYSVFLCDVDNFKHWNDIYSYEVGDIALQTVSQLIKDGFGLREGWTARQGGDEFISIVENVDEATAMKIGEKVRESIEKVGTELFYSTLRKKGLGDIAKKMEENGEKLSISMGIAMGYRDMIWKDVVSQANLALKEGKKGGKNRVNIYQPTVQLNNGLTSDKDRLQTVDVDDFLQKISQN